MLTGEEFIVRLSAAMALKEIGNHARDAAPALMTALSDPNERGAISMRCELNTQTPPVERR